MHIATQCGSDSAKVRILAVEALIITVLVSAPARAGIQLGLVINEINYAPSSSATDSSLRFEYVEIYNRSADPIDVHGWTLRDLDASLADETLYVFPSMSIPSSAFLTVYANAATGILSEDTDLSDHSGRLIATAWTGAKLLNNSGDAVQLYDVPGTTIQDFVFYDDSDTGDQAVDDDAVAEGIWKNGAAIDTLSSGTTGRAIALRIDGATPNEVNPAANAEDLDWMQYPLAIGGTPGGPNSPTSGDYNGDGTVDAADYVVWRKNDGTQLGYDTWRTNFGRTAGSGSGANANAAVPEPTSLVLQIFAAIGWCLRRRRVT